MNTIDTLICERGKHALAYLRSDAGEMQIDTKVTITRGGKSTRVPVTFRASEVKNDDGVSGGAVACACRKTYLLDPVTTFRDRRFSRHLIQVPE